MQIFVNGLAGNYVLDCEQVRHSNPPGAAATVRAIVEEVEGTKDLAIYVSGRPLEQVSEIEHLATVQVCPRLRGGKQHGSLAKVGKVKGQTPKVEKDDNKPKAPTGRAKKRRLYNKRFGEVVVSAGGRGGRGRGPNSNRV